MSLIFLVVLVTLFMFNNKFDSDCETVEVMDAEYEVIE